jgi:dipeptidyl aminopeptidase/acylaminoacyl peptidase
VAFSPDGKRAVTTADDDTARLWDAESGNETNILRHISWVLSAAFSPDGKRVVTGSSDGTARLWDAESGNEIAILNGHTRVVETVAFSPDGRRVVTASSDATARLWEAGSGREIAVLMHNAPVNSAAFSPDGKHILTASTDSTARLWDIQPVVSVKELIATAVGRVPRCLRPEERKKLFLEDEAPAWCYELNKWPYRRLRFGFSFDDARTARLRLPKIEGIVVTGVNKGLPADLAGLSIDDVIIAIDGDPVNDKKAFSATLERAPAGGVLQVTILRAGERREIELKPRY